MASSAPVTETADIRNVVVFGHGGCGKTSLVDSLCSVAGNTNPKGDIDKGSALTDFTAEEIAHKISINLGVAHARWNGTKVNLIDTPGYLDFFGEVMAGMRVADSGLCVIDAVHGVEVGTESPWAAADFQGLTRMIFVWLMDRDNANFQKTFQQIKGIQELAKEYQVDFTCPKGVKPTFDIKELYKSMLNKYDMLPLLQRDVWSYEWDKGAKSKLENYVNVIDLCNG